MASLQPAFFIVQNANVCYQNNDTVIVHKRLLRRVFFKE